MEASRPILLDPSQRANQLQKRFRSIDAIGRQAYALLKAYAKSNGLRTFDSLIAATAMLERRTLVTRNRKHFEMIGGLAVDVPEY